MHHYNRSFGSLQFRVKDYLALHAFVNKMHSSLEPNTVNYARVLAW